MPPNCIHEVKPPRWDSCARKMVTLLHKYVGVRNVRLTAKAVPKEVHDKTIQRASFWPVDTAHTVQACASINVGARGSIFSSLAPGPRNPTVNPGIPRAEPPVSESRWQQRRNRNDGRSGQSANGHTRFGVRNPAGDGDEWHPCLHSLNGLLAQVRLVTLELPRL